MNAYILVFLGTFVFGGLLGYLLGFYTSTLVDKIRTLQEPEVEKPQVTMGVYTKQAPNIGEKDSPVGLVETKTPQRLDWDAEQSIEAEGRGIGPA